MITRIEIDGFKTFEDFSLDVSPFLVLLGANGSGKSNLLEAVALLGRLVKDPRGQTLVRYARRGGARELFRRGPEGGLVDAMRLSANVLVRTPLGAAHVRVEMTIDTQGASETLAVQGRFTCLGSEGLELPRAVAEQIDRNATRVLRGDPDPVAENQAQRAVFGAVREAVAGWRILDLQPEAMRRPSDAYDSDPLAEDGSNLGAVLGRLWEGKPEGKAGFEADVAAVLPEVRKIDVARDVERGQWDIWIRHRNEPKMPPQVVSGGTLRLLGLLAAAHDPVHSGVLMLEEPENGLHPSRVPRLLERLRERATDLRRSEPQEWEWYGGVGRGDSDGLHQILVTSHSPVVLSSLLDKASHDVVFLDTVTRLGGGQSPTRLTRARKVAGSGERGTYVTPMEVRQYLNPVGYEHGA
ncbi:AAA family ATPase [Streptomyces sp. NPDC005648]|uniref:AAA family ATPase n=1 Tax=Streptomyces sp. NPDC005648 TaxID=3157044 RepID=UPI0033BA1159